MDIGQTPLGWVRRTFQDNAQYVPIASSKRA
jgi:hypothetical protein